MGKPKSKRRPAPLPSNRRSVNHGLMDTLRNVNRRAHEHANQRSGKRSTKTIQVAIRETDPMFDEFDVGFAKRVMRRLIAILLLPFCWVTTWTFLTRFWGMTNEGFWQSREFWYFAMGVVLMIGWFSSGLLKSFFLYIYVLGHELTHAVFVLIWQGKVTEFHVSTSGGYITTNKTNWMIALSPYFVPLWSVIAAVIFALLRLFFDLGPAWSLAFYGVMGVTWTFHVAWTLWMIPRDQPDLKENGTFLSLVVIFFGNLLVLVGLLCLASGSPIDSFVMFGKEWIGHAAIGGDAVVKSVEQMISELRIYGKF